MGEHFLCHAQWVRFSNGAIVSLLQHWAMRADQRISEPGMRAVRNYLWDRLISGADGGRAFGMDREVFPEALFTPETVAALAELIEETARDVTAISDVRFDGDLSRNWERRLWLLRYALELWAGPWLRHRLLEGYSGTSGCNG